MKLFNKEINLKKTSLKRAEKDKTTVIEEAVDTEASSPEKTDADIKKVPEKKKEKKGLKPSLFSKRGKSKKTEKKKEKKSSKGQKTGSNKLMLPLLILILIFLGGFLAKDKFIKKSVPVAVKQTPIKKENLKTVYEAGSDIIYSDFEASSLGGVVGEFLFESSLYLWMEYNERGVLIYHDILNKDIDDTKAASLSKPFERLKFILKTDKVPVKSKFLLTLSRDENKVLSTFNFLPNNTEAGYFLYGAPVDKDEDLTDIPLKKGKISGIMIGSSKSALMTNGDILKIGDRIKDGMVTDIHARYVLATRNGETKKIFIGQSF